MIHVSKLMKRSLLAFGVAGAAMLWNGHVPLDGQTSLVSSADARIGRPWTPVSYAGVARRTTARAVAVGAGTAAAVGAARVGAVTYGAAAVGAATVGAAATTATVRAAVPGGCVRIIGPLGRAATVCR
jgi:hypothetical protein